MPCVLVTGSSGLIGSACVRHYAAAGWAVHGADNNQRRDFFGPDGDTSANLAALRAAAPRFEHHPLDIRDRDGVRRLVADVRPDLLIHAAAQPSHDLAASRPFDDFEVNATGTLNLLEAVRRHAADAVFCFMSTNKVYGDAPNELPLVETDTRWEYARPEDVGGVREDMRIDRSTHSLFGVSKTAADLMVQEYGRYFGLRTGCFRGGCLTGAAHAAAELHGFLAYLVRCAAEGRKYRVLGYKGKQVRDNLHAADVCRAFDAFYRNPRPGEVYNLGGGRDNSVSILEAIGLVERAVGKKLDWEYVDKPRVGDHVCYISDLTKFRGHYPDWRVTMSLPAVVDEMARAAGGRA